jgi:glutathione S-transferase
MYTLYIGEKNYSSWSLRPWLLMQALDLPFSEVAVQLDGMGANEKHRKYSPNGLVPCLHDDQLQVWDTLAIFEYLHEHHGVWPENPQARAKARSVSAEMHSGFGALRESMPMNIKLKLNGREPSSVEQSELGRITTIWNSCRDQYGEKGEYLFGQFCAADAMFAPLIWRFETYNVILDGDARRYQQTMLAMPAMRRWEKAALQESTVFPKYDSLADSFGGPR